MIIDELINRIDNRQCPIVMGLDPVISKIPTHIREEARNHFGNTLEGAAEACFAFNRELIEAVHTLIPAVKLQMACYECYDQWGIDVFKRTVALCRSHDLTVIDDSKRNDIGSTAELYAIAHLGQPPLIEGLGSEKKADFLTINPFLGRDSILPFIEQCKSSDKGLFVLARTSNPSAGEYQDALIDGVPLYLKVAQFIAETAESWKGESGYSPMGAVVGATWPREMSVLREAMPCSYFLMPGYGAQGATSDDAVHAFKKDGYGALINSSRAICYAYLEPRFREGGLDEEGFARAASKAVIGMRDDLLRSLIQADKLPENW